MPRSEPQLRKKIPLESVVIPIILTVIALSFFIFFQSGVAYSNYTSDKTLSPIYESNTRIFTSGNITFKIPFDSTTSTELADSTVTKFGSGCPPEIAIYIHGFNKNDIEANEEYNRIQASLAGNNYRIPLVGFSWDSKVDWPTAKTYAKDNGPMLALYIISFHEKCTNTDIRIIAHSLGATIVDNALVNLSNNANWTSKIASVHLLGAAIDNQRLANNSSLSSAAEAIVDKFYNLYNPEDDGLKANQAAENHFPLGLFGAPNGTVHLNYNDTNVTYEIPPFSDADGDGNLECFEYVNIVKLWGDNHCGYIGFRNPLTGTFSDDGAMNIVVRDWMKP